MSSPKIGLKAPRFKGDCTGKEGFVDSADLKGKRIVLYFYPKDSTPGCTTEGQNFRDLFKKFKKENTVIFGLSRESIKSHDNFKEKQGFPFELISDPEEKICNQFDVIKEKSMYGRKYFGIERTTLLINEKSFITKIWNKVKVNNHVEEVIEFIEKN